MITNPFRRTSDDPALARLGTDAAGACAALHASAFAHGWDASEFEALLASAAVEATGAWRGGTLVGFVLARAAGDEAEILTLAVARAARNRGLGRRLMEATRLALEKARVRRVFLEVGDDNAAALRLYAHLGFQEVGRRENYYRRDDGSRTHALVLRYEMR